MQSSEVVQIEVDKILVPEERVTSVLDEETLQELEASIREKGILQPLLVGEVDGKYVLIDGLHRLYIAKKLGMKTVPCIVKKMSEEELIITNLIVNRQRGKSNPADEARIVKLLIDDYKYSLNAVAEKLNMSRSTVEKYYQIAKNATQKLLEALKYGQISVGCAYYLSMIEDKQKQDEVVDHAVKWQYTVDQCKAAALSATMPSYTPEPGGWMIDASTGQPVRVKVKTALCNIEEDPALVVNIPVPARYADVVREILSNQDVCNAITGGEGGEAAEAKAEEKREVESGVVWEW
ncbi:MAG: ParB/RepB/Spo0J family partition protein [Pyrobaculum sp.]|uniref:ParB/RepB/Spo0J family partition protein n=1 Tax=Pyrobaculum sp. TaxID=2004705 RepID=UPI003178A8F2